MADALRLTEADLERLGPAARKQVEEQLGKSAPRARGASTGEDEGAGTSVRSGGRPSSSRWRRRRRRVKVPAAVTRPVRGPVRRASGLFVAAIALSIAYWALQNPAAVEVVLRTPVAVLRWLADPTRSIPYAQE